MSLALKLHGFTISKPHYTIKLVCLLGLLVSAPQLAHGQWPIFVDSSGYDKSSSIKVTQEGQLLAVVWPGEGGQTLRVRFNLVSLPLLIRDISVLKDGSFHPILEDASPAYMSFTGKRRGGWDNFFDSPALHLAEIRTADSTLKANMCQVTSDHQRVQVSINGFESGIFHGKLVFTFYSGSSLVQQEAVVQTDEPDVAYYYNAWLQHCSTKNIKSVAWLNTEGELVRHPLLSELDYWPQVLKVQRRALVAEGPNGSLGLFPPPHQFFFPRDETINFGYVWYRLNEIQEKENLFSFGIRQDPAGAEDEPAPLYNAPPGTDQHWKLLYYISGGNGPQALSGISAFTHNDSFKAIPGYKTFTSHYHMRVTMDAIAHKGEPSYVPDFKGVFKQMGVNMVHLNEYHGSGHPSVTTPVRLQELQAQYDECKRLSDPEFLLIPGEEGDTYFGGHWGLLLPRPVYWFWVRPEGTPFEDQQAPYGKVYHLGGSADTYEMISKENGLVWQTHPRTKGSTGYPDRIMNEDYFKDPRWIGAAFKAMPSDLSSPRLGERSLRLFDDMNNWGGRRFLVGEADIFKIDHTHELYGHSNINYLRMDRVPPFSDWGPVLDVLKRGDFFVSTGEVLIRDFRVGGKRPGESLALDAGSPTEISADLEWTFPLNIVELVWGDGKNTDRLIVPAGETSAYGQKVFHFSKDLKGAKWIRFAAWDVTANGAFTQPVYIEQHGN